MRFTAIEAWCFFLLREHLKLSNQYRNVPVVFCSGVSVWL